MKIFSWNCHGLGNPRAVEELEDLISSFMPTVVFLMEVKVDRGVVDNLKAKKNFEVMFYVPHINNGGGLALLWKERDMVQLRRYSRNFIDSIISMEDFPKWRLTGYYGFPESSRRRQSWNLIQHLAYHNDLPWCMVGDLND